jgi:hypothetical protein
MFLLKVCIRKPIFLNIFDEPKKSIDEKTFFVDENRESRYFTINSIPADP